VNKSITEVEITKEDRVHALEIEKWYLTHHLEEHGQAETEGIIELLERRIEQLTKQKFKLLNPAPRKTKKAALPVVTASVNPIAVYEPNTDNLQRAGKNGRNGGTS
jgi:hypothetical protein